MFSKSTAYMRASGNGVPWAHIHANMLIHSRLPSCSIRLNCFFLNSFLLKTLLSANGSNHKAPLIHTVCVLWLYFVEADFAAYLLKLYLVVITKVSSLAFSIH
jgi:hypothetical protein